MSDLWWLVLLLFALAVALLLLSLRERKKSRLPEARKTSKNERDV